MKRRLRDWAPLVGLWLVVTAYYVFVISAGTFKTWHVWSAFYDAQAQALLNGHLYLPEPPSRTLLSLADPLNIANMPHWRWDHALYGGHLHMYWGLVPAFIAAAVKALVHPAGVPDNSLTFAFCVIRLVAGTLLIRAVARAVSPRPPRWAVALAMVVFALANPTPYTLARAGIYEAAIMGGAAFILAGLYLGHRALTARGALAATAWLATASLSFGLAGGSRLSLIPAVAALAMLAGLWRWRQARRLHADGKQHALAPGLAALLPAGAIGVGLLITNYLRFGSLFEFGHSYTMTFPYFVGSLRFLAPDVFAYGIAPPDFTCWFPYVSAPWNTIRVSTPGWLPLNWPADHFSIEPSIGLLVATPFVALAGVAGVVAIGRVRLTSASLSAIGWINWLWVALLVWVLGAAPMWILNVTTMRYQQDFASALLLLAIVGGWRLLAAPQSRRGRLAMAWVYGGLAVVTIVAGVLLGFTGYFKHFDQHNPALMRALVAKLSFCR